MNHLPANPTGPGSPAPKAGESAPLANPIRLPGGAGGEKAVPPSALSAAPNAWALFKAFRRRWLMALTLGALAALTVGIGGWYLFPQGKYTAAALLRVSSVQPAYLLPTTEGHVDFLNYKKTQQALVKTHTVLAAALRNPRVANLRLLRNVDAFQWLETNLKTDFTLAPELLRISLSGDNEEELKILVNAVKDAYMEQIINREQTKRRDRGRHLREIYKRYETSLKIKKKALMNLAQKMGTGDTAQAKIMQAIAVEQLKKTQNDLVLLRSKLTHFQVELADELAKAEQKKPEVKVPDDLLEEHVEKDPLVQKHKAAVLGLEASIAEIKRISPKKAFLRNSRAERAQLRSTKNELENRRRQLRVSLGVKLRDQLQRGSPSHAAKLKDQIAFLKKLEESLVKDVKSLARENKVISTKSVKLKELTGEIDQAETTMKRVGQEVEALEVERDAPTRVIVQEEAVVTPPDNFKRKMLAAGGGGLGSFVLVVLAVSWWEFRSRRINSVDELVHGLGINLVGTLPNLPAAVRFRRAAGNSNRDLYWNHLLTESVDAARTMLLHAAQQESLRVVMVTSATPGEGKTSLATHLAASLARARRRTLLLDCDLRNPSIHRLFDLDREPGFSELLRKEVAVDDALRPTLVHGLEAITAGKCDTAALQELSQDHCAEIFRRLKEQYDFIVVDAPPTLPVADCLLLGPHMDAVIFSLMHEISELPKVYAAHQRLSLLGVRILGAVVSGAPGSVIYSSDYRYVPGNLG
jgi:capsular exopolysaccharide synthesis family protein